MSDITPITREEALLDGQDLTPITRKEQFIKRIYDTTQVIPEPATREEWFLKKAGEGSSPVTVEALSVTENGTYSEAGKAYSPVTVEVPLPTNANERKSVTSYPVTDSANYPLPKCDVTVTDADKCEVIVTTDNTITEDSGVYIERQSGGGNRELDEIVGGSVVWNQLVQNGNFADTSGWTVAGSGTQIGASNHELSIEGTSDYFGVYQSISVVTGHKYLQVIHIKVSSLANRIIPCYTDSSYMVSQAVTPIDTNYHIYSEVKASTSTGNCNVGVRCSTYNDAQTITVRDMMLIDLTALFGTTIADYIYSLEQSTAGSGIAWLKSYGYLTEDYYGYTANKIESVSVARHIMKDSNDAVIGSYPINPITLRGIPKLNASNQLYYDGDVYEASGRVTRMYKSINLGDLTWTPNATYSNTFNSDLTEYGKPYIGSADYIPTWICSKYEAYASIYVGEKSKGIAISDNGQRVYVRDVDYSDATTFKTAMSGVYLVYELATPTTESTSPFEPNQIVDANGTEEYIDAGVEAGTRDVAIPVGHDTKYYNGKAYVKPLTAGTSDTVSMADMGIMPTSPMYIEANETLDVEYWKSNS